MRFITSSWKGPFIMGIPYASAKVLSASACAVLGCHPLPTHLLSVATCHLCLWVLSVSTQGVPGTGCRNEFTYVPASHSSDGVLKLFIFFKYQKEYKSRHTAKTVKFPSHCSYRWHLSLHFSQIISFNNLVCILSDWRAIF